MQAKFVFGGEGMKIPGTDFGLSFALFKVWFCPVGGEFRGYTTASNEGLLGGAIIESPVVDFVMRDLEDEEPFMDLHGSAVVVRIKSSIFAFDGGTATLTLAVRNNDGTPAKELTFFSDECRGLAAALGEIHFAATLVQLPAEEWDATQVTFVP